MVSLADSPKRIIEEIKAILSKLVYVTSLIGWTELKYGRGSRSKLGSDYDAAVSEFYKASGIDAMMEESQELESVRRSLALRKKMAEVNLYLVTKEDRKEAERLGLEVTGYMAQGM